MRIGLSYKQNALQGPYDAIVIGSGIGGLSCASLLAKHGGQRVAVLERHYTAGGFTHVFRRPGYEWDVGVHYIGQMHPRGLVRRAFDEISDGSLMWADMGDVYDTIVFGKDRYDFMAGRDAWRHRMVEYFPKEETAIDRYIELVRSAARSLMAFYGEKIVPNGISAVVGGLMRYPAMRHAKKTTGEVLASLTDNRRLRAVLAGQYGDYGLPPAQSSFLMHAMVVHHYFNGGAYPVGGSSRIAESILPVIRAEGGEVFTSAAVEEILIEKGRAAGVRLAGGEELRAPLVISDAGVANTFNRLLPEEHGAPLRRLLTSVEPSVGHGCLYLGFKGSAEQLGLTKPNVWSFPHDDHDKAVRDFIDDDNAPLPLAYLSFPAAKDPEFDRRHPGRSTVEVITLAPFAWFEKWKDSRWKKRDTDYEALKSKLTDRMLASLYAEHPQLSAHLDHAELSTPLTTRHFSAFDRGELYGLSHTPARCQQKWLRPSTKIPGLLLTGADVCSAGVGGALFGGVLTASTVLRRNLSGVISRRAAVEEPLELGNTRWA
ncbi:MAG: NAD(P)/FAD-dependent oxidoreductase [Myxococcota bacterium]